MGVGWGVGVLNVVVLDVMVVEVGVVIVIVVVGRGIKRVGEGRG